MRAPVVMISPRARPQYVSARPGRYIRPPRILCSFRRTQPCHARMLLSPCRVASGKRSSSEGEVRRLGAARGVEAARCARAQSRARMRCGAGSGADWRMRRQAGAKILEPVRRVPRTFIVMRGEWRRGRERVPRQEEAAHSASAATLPGGTPVGENVRAARRAPTTKRRDGLR